MKSSNNSYNTSDFLKGRDVVFANVLRDSACGHLYECIEYYYLFKTEKVDGLDRNLNPGIYLAYDNFTKEDFKKTITSKYDFSVEEVDDILDNTLIESIDSFCSKKIHDFREVKTTVFVEAFDLVQMRDFNMIMLTNNLVGLRCADEEKRFKDIEKRFSGLKVFQDYRVYGGRLNDKFMTDHSKKILFNKLKKFDKCETNTAFIYLATDCRELPSAYLADVIKQYPQFDKVYVAVLDIEKFRHLESDKIEFIIPPLDNLHSLFDTLIYLPVKRQFDCSPRLVPECAYYGKKVIYHNITYRDLGLDIRRKDIKAGVDTLQLTRDDLLFKEVGDQCL